MHVEVFADITCPFTHVGLKRVVAQLDALDRPTPITVRAWPLEWVNGVPLAADAVATKAAVLTEQLEVSDFTGFDPVQWPASTVPALNLAAMAYTIGSTTGLAVSLELRSALFEHGRDVGDPDVLADIARTHGIDGYVYQEAPRAEVAADYELGQQLGVKGSPEFRAGGAAFFCPALTLGHDDAGELLADFDPMGLQQFISQVTANS